MRRREFITLLGGAAAVAARCARAAAGNADHRISGPGIACGREPMGRRFRAAAARTRLDEGRTVAIEVSMGGGPYERIAEIAAEFVALKVDVIVTAATAPVLPPRQATSAIPIVFAVEDDPVGSGLVTSLTRPGGNVTGLSVQ